MMLREENRNNLRKISPSATLYITDLTWADLESYLGICSEMWHDRSLQK
jgi:hypothetical protein